MIIPLYVGMTYSSYALLLTVWVLMTLISGDKVMSPLVIAPKCSEKCGNMSIPYPFGIEDGCYYKPPNNDTSFRITCNNTKIPPTPILGINFEVLNISVIEGELRTQLHHVSYDCYNHTDRLQHHQVGFHLSTTFTLSSNKNMLVAIGCDTSAWFTGDRGGKKYETGCMTKCVELEDAIGDECSGIGCCQASIPSGIRNTQVVLISFNNHVSVYTFNPCSVAFPVAKDAFTFNYRNLTQTVEYYENLHFPVVFSWTIGRNNCAAAIKDGSCLCKENAVCYDPVHETGYRCNCTDGYSGNPYLPNGCTDIDECKGENDCEKAEYCSNTVGSYNCKCPRGYHGDGTKTHGCISNIKPWLIPVLTTAGIGGGIIILLLFGFILHNKHGKSRIRKMRESFFRQNGGVLLHEKLSGRHVDTLKIFTTQDLETASNNYSDKNIIGRGGFGVVYKGILPNNNAVAIKKSLKVDPNQVEQFINEILILSQINNRNVVRLLGCCLETEVPLLVYEFINNGTLYDHLNDFNPCSVAFPVAKDAFTFNRRNLSQPMEYYRNLQLPVVFSWTIGQNNCSAAKKDGSCLCKENTVCYDPVHENGYRCNCIDGYSGNPYLPHGCTDNRKHLFLANVADN